ncbi:hypothetical protein [Solirubrobacter soli]|uniref:hypothetical protein n=1 Tax=Solirubrobacter soli TaxID=363832 RepID=UPI0012F89B5E|nr:hypothetical protein [Solirubrobacter soli]
MAPLRTIPRRRISKGTDQVFGPGTQFLQASWDGLPLVRDAETGDEVLRETEPERMIGEVAGTQDGRRVAYASLTRDELVLRARAWPFETNAPVDVLRRAPPTAPTASRSARGTRASCWIDVD